MKKIIIPIIGLAVVIGGIFFFKTTLQSKPAPEQVVFQRTLDISKEYASLRYRTDNALMNAKDYGDYDAWKKDISNIIKDWENLDKIATNLEKSSQELIEEKVSINLVKKVNAYTKEEVTAIVDKAPRWQKINTLAKHLGVDAKMAQLILNQTQAEVSREAYGTEGDVFQKCENGAMRIKNGAKVTVFVGTIVATGGTSALAASGALAQTAVVVSGADLALEVTEDEARIALGDKNKVTEYVGNIRSVTEPAASILTLASIPGNLSKAGEKFAAANFGADQIRSVVQDKKILGISIKTESNGELKTEIAGLTEEELPQWKKDNNAPDSTQTAKEIIEQAQQAPVEEKEVVENGETKTNEVKNKMGDIPNQIIKVVNVSSDSYMMDTCFTSTCWDDLDADPREDRDLGGIYTMGKVFANGESFKTGFRPADQKAAGRLIETSPNSYKITLYFAIAPHEGPKNKTIDYGTWLSESVEINANYGDEPVIEWDGSTLKQKK